MTQYFTIENIAFAFLLLRLAESVLARVAPLTSWGGDDKAVDIVKRGRDWIRVYAPLFLGVVEDMANSGLFPKAQKAFTFVNKIEEEWKKAHPGVPMPPEVKAEVEAWKASASAIFPHEEKTPQGSTEAGQGASIPPSTALPPSGNPPVAPA